MNAREIAYIVDDNEDIRVSLSACLAGAGVTVIAFSSIDRYLSHCRSDEAGCLVIDEQAEGIRTLQAVLISLPVVWLTGSGDVTSAVRAMKSGAIDVLTKPVNGEGLCAAVKVGLAEDRVKRELLRELAFLHGRYDTLSPRERQVLPFVVSGLLNKQSAALLGIGEVTLQIHRSQIMRKMSAASFADLVRMASTLEIPLVSQAKSGLDAARQRTGHSVTFDIASAETSKCHGGLSTVTCTAPMRGKTLSSPSPSAGSPRRFNAPELGAFQAANIGIQIGQ